MTKKEKLHTQKLLFKSKTKMKETRLKRFQFVPREKCTEIEGFFHKLMHFGYSLDRYNVTFVVI